MCLCNWIRICVVTMHLLLHLHTATCCVDGREGTCPFTLQQHKPFPWLAAKVPLKTVSQICWRRDEAFLCPSPWNAASAVPLPRQLQKRLWARHLHQKRSRMWWSDAKEGVVHYSPQGSSLAVWLLAAMTWEQRTPLSV